MLLWEEKAQAMRKGGQFLHTILRDTAQIIVPGINVLDVEDYVNTLFAKYDLVPSFLGFQGFPSSICICVNDEVVHGIPKDRILKDGDIITLDCGVFYDGYHTDSAITVYVGAKETMSEEISHLLNITEGALKKAVQTVRAGIPVGKVSAVIGTFARENGLTVVEDLGGHGIGKTVHEEPYIANEGAGNEGPLLRAGMTIAVEPIFCLGKGAIVVDKKDGWTIRTRDGSLSAQFEHTLLVLDGGCEVLT